MGKKLSEKEKAQRLQDQKNEYLKNLTTAGRDIGSIPPVADPARREACRLNFRLFCETYFPAVFCLDWSDDHLRVIDIIQQATLGGGLFALAMPRGSGKTSLTICAAEWALLFGHRSFVVLIGASEDAACDLLTNIGIDLETNDLLNDDFPEVCHPIRSLERIVNRAKGQTCQGEPTYIEWTARELVLPTITGSAASGSRVKVAGITGRIRGMSASVNGAKIRPDFCLIDDPQTDESASSPKQVRDRLAVVNKAILGLSAPGKKISAVMPCTVIAKNDLAEQALDRKVCPHWQGLRFGLLRTFPTNVKRWDEYAAIRAQGLREEQGLTPATAFYRANRTELDEGAEAAWTARFEPDEASAVQHAMNLKLRNEEAFYAEYQNAPLSLEQTTPLTVTPDSVFAKIVGTERGIVPKTASRLTAMIDVQGSVLFWTVCAFSEDMTAHVVDYAAYPDQKRNYFTLRDLSPTLGDLLPGKSAEAQLHAGLAKLAEQLLTRVFARDGGGQGLTVSRLMIDAGYESTVVKQFISQSSRRAQMLPSMGRAVTAKNAPLEYWKQNPGDRVGWKWRVNTGEGHLLADVNAWKTFAAQRLLSPLGEAGTLTVFDGKPEQHRMLADHVSSEFPTLVSANGRDVNEWTCRPNRDNHWLDCLIGCFVAASEQGIAFFTQKKTKEAPRRHRPRLRLTI